jgi:hypothetical protein
MYYKIRYFGRPTAKDVRDAREETIGQRGLQPIPELHMNV